MPRLIAPLARDGLALRRVERHEPSLGILDRGHDARHGRDSADRRRRLNSLQSRTQATETWALGEREDVPAARRDRR